MAKMKFYAECNGAAVELAAVAHDGSPYVGVTHFTGRCVCGARHVAGRMVERKANPSNHRCDDRCLNATGTKCECACNGANHGRGRFFCAAA